MEKHFFLLVPQLFILFLPGLSVTLTFHATTTLMQFLNGPPTTSTTPQGHTNQAPLTSFITNTHHYLVKYPLNLSNTYFERTLATTYTSP